MTNGFALNHEKSLQIYFCVKLQAKNDFLKDVESTIEYTTIHLQYTIRILHLMYQYNNLGLFELEFYCPANTIKVMLSLSLNLLTFFPEQA